MEEDDGGEGSQNAGETVTGPTGQLDFGIANYGRNPSSRVWLAAPVLQFKGTTVSKKMSAAAKRQEPIENLVMKLKLLDFSFEKDGSYSNPYGVFYKRRKSRMTPKNLGASHLKLFPKRVEDIPAIGHLHAVAFICAYLRTVDPAEHKRMMANIDVEFQDVADTHEICRIYYIMAKEGLVPSVGYSYAFP